MDSVQSNSQPLVSILITSYNRARWIGQAIESAMAQDYENLEIIISDDGSTDNSHEVINKYTNDPRIRYSRNEKNLGITATLNKGLPWIEENTDTKYIARLDCGDICAAERFGSLVRSIC